MFNEQIFRNNLALLEKLLLYRLKEIEEKIESIRSAFDIASIETRIPYQTPEQYDALWEESSEKMKRFFGEHGGYPVGFLNKINDLRTITGLGREWNVSFCRLAITGVLLPPPFSVFVDEDRENKTITFETNKNTTRDDLLRAWDLYADARIDLFGRTRAHHVSQEEVARIGLIKQLEATKEKEGLTDKQVAVNLTPSYDESGEERPMKEMDKEDEKNKDWIKKNRERFKKEVTS